MFLSQPAVPDDLSPHHSAAADPVLAMMTMIPTYPAKSPHTREDRMAPPTPHPHYAYDPTPGSQSVIFPTPRMYNPPVPGRGKRNADKQSAEGLKDAVQNVLHTIIE